MDARYCKPSLNSSITSRHSRRGNQTRWNNPRSLCTSSGFIPSPNLQSLRVRLCTCTEPVFWRPSWSCSLHNFFLRQKLERQNCSQHARLYADLVPDQQEKSQLDSSRLSQDNGDGDSSVVGAPDSWLRGPGFKSPQERRENFLLQGRLSVLILISVSVPPPCYRSST